MCALLASYCANDIHLPRMECVNSLISLRMYITICAITRPVSMTVIYMQSYPTDHVALGIVNPEGSKHAGQVDSNNLSVRFETRTILEQSNNEPRHGGSGAIQRMCEGCAPSE